jgi:hypothetical protein
LQALKLGHWTGFESQFVARQFSSLVVSDQSQDHAEARLAEEAAVLGICYLPYFAEDIWGDFGALEEGDSILAGDDA